MPQGEYLQFGGMAVIEGVMMRSPNYWALACRAPNGKIIVYNEHLEKTWIGRQQWLKKPFLRGTLAMLDTMALGMRAMRIAGDIQMEPLYQKPEDIEMGLAEKQPSKAATTIAIGLAILVSLSLGFLLFNAAPQFLAVYLVRAFSGEPASQGNTHLTLTNYLAEIIKMVFFIGYLSLISLLPTIREVFRYHGAEHKAINAMEDGVALEPAACQSVTRLHPRCGTNFAIIVIVVSFLLFPLIPRDLFVPGTSPGWLIALTRLPVELLCLPLVAGISYEVIRLAGKAKNQAWVKILLAPGLATQLITTAEPDDKHIEVAIESLKAVVKAEETGELTNNGDPNAESTPKQPAKDGESVEDVIA